MAAALTDQMAADLAPATRTALLEILDLFDSVAGQIGQLTEAFAALDRLDDLRNEQIQELRLTVRLLCHAQGLDTSGDPLAQLARAYLDRQEHSVKAAEQTVYFAEIARLRAKREQLRGGGEDV